MKIYITVVANLYLSLFQTSSVSSATRSRHHQIFTGAGRSVAPSDEYFKSDLASTLAGTSTESSGTSTIVKIRRQTEEDVTEPASDGVADVNEGAAPSGSAKIPFQGHDIKWYGETDADDVPMPPMWPFLKPLLNKFATVVNLLTHPNVALTPFYVLSRLKQRIYEHIKDKLDGGSQDYPYPYRFHD